MDKSVYTYAKNVTCPYCGHVDTDSWELDFGLSSDEEILAECGACEETFKVARTIEVTYSSILPEDVKGEAKL